MLDWVSGKLVKNEQISAEIIIASSFVLTVDNKAYQNVTASLYQDFIILENKKSSFRVMIVFQPGLLFEIIRFKDENGFLGSPRSIKFLYGQNWLELKNSSIPKEMHTWIEKLNLKLNQQGFHDCFQAIKKIGRGGFASVYLVKKKHSHQQIAVKAFSKQAVVQQSRGLDSIQKQVSIMRTLNHPNLMKLQSVFQTPNSYYMCLELLSGGSLADKIRKKAKLSSLSIKKIMKSLLEGLQYLHEKNIMHRDLKPDNILFRNLGDDECVIADFGLGEYAHTKEYLYSRCGTPGYVAPEVANLKNPTEKYTVACDMFSLGVIFHILALRKTPFEGRSYNQILIKNRNCQIDFNESCYKQIPQTWLDFMKKLLTKDPKRRITASEALEHEFFREQVVFRQQVQQRRRESRQKVRNSSTSKAASVNSCGSNVLLSESECKKNRLNLKEDSCLKFKMQQNLITGKIQQTKENSQQVDSPMIIKKNFKTSGESRFKCRA